MNQLEIHVLELGDGIRHSYLAKAVLTPHDSFLYGLAHLDEEHIVALQMYSHHHKWGYLMELVHMKDDTQDPGWMYNFESNDVEHPVFWVYLHLTGYLHPSHISPPSHKIYNHGYLTCFQD